MLRSKLELKSSGLGDLKIYLKILDFSFWIAGPVSDARVTCVDVSVNRDLCWLVLTVCPDI